MSEILIEFYIVRGKTITDNNYARRRWAHLPRTGDVVELMRNEQCELAVVTEVRWGEVDSTGEQVVILFVEWK